MKTSWEVVAYLHK